MNTKLVAVLFALVSVSLCDIPAPSDDLVQKYDGYRNTLAKRLTNLYNKMKEATGPVVETAGDNPRVQVVKDFMEDLQTKPEFQAAVKVATGLGAEAGPLVDKARTAVLGLYQQYLRPYVGQMLNDAIEDIRVHLDKFMPAE